MFASYFAAISYEWLFGLFWVSLLVQFAVYEFIALRLAKKLNDNNEETQYDGVTLSEYVWRLSRRNLVAFAVFTAFWTWLTIHFLTGWL